MKAYFEAVHHMNELNGQAIRGGFEKMEWRKHVVVELAEDKVNLEKHEDGIMHFLTSDKFDIAMEHIINVLWKGILYFCTPYLAYLLFRIFL